MRPLSPASAIIANDLIDNGLADPHSPDQEIADTVNWRRTQHGQDALTQLGEMAPPPWRRRVLPADPTPYRIQEIRQHRLHRASTSMQSAPPAPPPAVALSGELAFDPMDFLDIPDTPISASSAPAFQEVANQSELSVPAGEPAPPAPPPAVALSGELAFDPMDFLDIPDTPISASSAPAFQEVANQSELSVPAGEPAPPAPPPAVALSGELAFDPMDFLDIPDTPISASSAPAFQEVANQSELSVPAGEPAPPAPPPAVALSGELAFDPMDFLDIPDTPISASSAPAFQEVANQSELSVPAGESVDCPAIAPPLHRAIPMALDTIPPLHLQLQLH